MKKDPLNVKIREATDKDIASIIKLLKISKLYYPEDDNPDNLKRKLARDKDLMIVATINKRVIGFVMGTYDGWAAIVWHLSVLPEFRKLGIAKTLLLEIEQRLKQKGAQVLYGLVQKDNLHMLELIPKLSFQKAAEVLVVSRKI